MVLRGGENVYSAEVEAAIYEHPSVAEAAVFAVPDERLGEAVGVAIVKYLELNSRQKNFKIMSAL